MIRRPVAAGVFYPSDPSDLAAAVDALLDRAGRQPDPAVRAIVAPHAGYVYSGAVAARAFALLAPQHGVVLLGPSHFVPLDGMAVTGADGWATPLGEIPIHGELRELAVRAGAVVDERPHLRDHALEVELPFLQRGGHPGLEVLPLAVGGANADEVAELLQSLGALVIVSTDLSHFHDEATASRLDGETADAVVRREPAAIAESAACGVFALRGLVEHARRADLDVELLDLKTSADSSGDAERVVGYGAFAATASRSRGCRRRGSP